MARTTKAMLEEQIKVQNEEIKALKKALKDAKKATPKKDSKKSAPKKPEKKTREEYLNEKYGDLEHRKAYIEVKNKVAAEMKAEAKASGKYWSRSDYKKELYKRTMERMGA